MAHFAHVSRDWIYDRSRLTSMLPPHFKPDDCPPDPNDDSMTWQQKQNFGGHKKHKGKGRRNARSKWKPLDLTTDIPTSPVMEAPGNDHWGGQAYQDHSLESELPQKKQSEPTPSPSQLLSGLVETDLLPDSTHALQSQQAAPLTPTSLIEEKRMAAVPQSAYVPPHLRKQKSTGKQTGASNCSGFQTSEHDIPESLSDKPKHDMAMKIQPPSNPAPHRDKSTLETSPVVKNDAERSGKGSHKTSPKVNEPTTQPPATSFKQQNKNRRQRAPVRKKTVWVKSRDIKPAPSDEASEGGVECWSNSNGDPDYDVKKLMDWNGDWMPPPETWAARKGFTDRHFGQHIEKWIDGHHESCQGKMSMDITGEEYMGKIAKELVPRTWLPLSMEGDAPQQFWASLSSRAPPALSDDGQVGSRPWWELYPDNDKGCYINSLAVPEAKLDPNDPENTHLRATIGIDKALAMMKDAREARYRKTMQKRSRPVSVPVVEVPDQGLKPIANFYLRPVKLTDAKAIAEIYNYYVKESCSANEFDERTEREIQNRVDVIIQAGLPYLVAVSRKNKRGFPSGDHIIGFAYLDDYCDQSSMYRYTFELEFYVHPEFIRKGIAKCMLDKILEMVSSGYRAKGGYEYVNQDEYLKFGPTRVVKTILVQAPHDKNDNMEWMTKFVKDFEFRRSGHHSEIGHKYGKVIDLTIYQHHTSETINATVRPPVGR